MADITIILPPGVVQEASRIKNTANYRETNLMRWDSGRLEPIGGFSKTTYATPPDTTIRAVHQWRDNSGRVWKAYLCEANVYVEADGDLVSINPTPNLEPYDGDFSTGGYGDGPYDDDFYGTPRSDVADRKKYGPAFTLDNWGEDLLIMSSVDGRLLRWVPPAVGDPVAAATVVTDAPTGCYSFVVTAERHVIVFQVSGNFNQYAWCDKEDLDDWDFADVASEAGYLPVEPSSPLVAPKYLGDAGTIFWTVQRVYVITYQGLPSIYGHDEKAEGTLPISSASVVRANEGAFWPSESGWWQFNGVSVVPLACNIWKWISEQWDLPKARQMAFTVHILSKAEIWFFFPTIGSDHNNRVAIFNYRDGWWAQAKLSRSAGTADDSLDNPILADRLAVYKHEYGTAYADADEGAYAETFTVNAAMGGNYSLIRTLLPEIEGDASRLSLRLITSTTRSPAEETLGPARKVMATGLAEFMQAARDFRIRISADDKLASDFNIGAIIADIEPKGRKK